MINAEKFKGKILTIAEDGYIFAINKNDKNNVIRCCSDMKCQDCIFDEEEDCGCSFSRMKWMLSEYKEPVKLTRLEYEVLKHYYNDSYKYIARDENGDLFLYIAKPSKGSNIWRSISDHHNLYDFRKKFQFVKWEDEKPTSIQEVLNNCEVIEDD